MKSTSVQCFPSEFICSICQDCFTDPVTISCGHRFCTPCLCLMWEDAHTPTCCPVCKAISPTMDFKSTILAKEHILPTRKSVVCQLPSSAKWMCRKHQVIKNYFCQTNKSLLCLCCSHSPEHATHVHYPIQQAAEHCRENLLIHMKSIWKKKQENQRNIKKVTSIFRVWEILNPLSYQGIPYYTTLYKGFDSVGTGTLTLYLHLITGVNVRCMLSFYFELLNLESVNSAVGYNKSQPFLMQQHVPQPMDPQLSTWSIPGMLERLNNFQVDVTLDDKIQNCHVALIEDMRRLRCRPDHGDTPRNPASSEYTPSWGAQTFTSGKHYWEVDVGLSCNWIIGLCKESWTSRNDMLLNSEDIFLLLCVKVDDNFHLFSTSPLLPYYIQRPQGWIGVFLDYECGIISFINVAKSSLICNFLSCSFSFPLRPFIWRGPK
uniref:Tripartite motif containing 77 n=1 Tax=Sus scrofa TaxID=9823 RepID=A0A8D1GAA3_PIG